MEILNEEVKNTFGAMTWAIIESLVLYLVIPMVVIGVILKLLKVKGQALKMLMGIVALACLFVFAKYGISHYEVIYQSRLAK